MARLLLHALTPVVESHPNATRGGLRGQPLRWIETGMISGWATMWEVDDSQLRRQDLFEHHRIVEVVWQESPCLPVRFPTWLADERSFADLIGGRETALVAALERVRGQVEIAVTVLWADALPASARASANRGRTRGSAPTGESHEQVAVPTGPGRRYLEARRQEQTVREWRHEEGQRFADALDEELRPLSTASEHRACPTDRVALSSALLVPRERASEMCERIVRLSGGWGGTRTLVNGPWPPYSFAVIDT